MELREIPLRNPLEDPYEVVRMHDKCRVVYWIPQKKFKSVSSNKLTVEEAIKVRDTLNRAVKEEM